MRASWTLGSVLIAATLYVSASSRAQSPGPYYFVPDRLYSKGQAVWGKTDSFGGSIEIVENFHLLSWLLGDRPPNNVILAPEQTFDYGSGQLELQPFARVVNLRRNRFALEPLLEGPRLRAFLNNPLDGDSFDLKLPFRDSRVALSDRSALLRGSGHDKAWHIAIDFDRSDGTKKGFDVLAPAQGFVVSRSRSGRSVTLEHRANVPIFPRSKIKRRVGRRFLTVYAYLEQGSTDHLTVGDPIAQGDWIGRVGESDAHAHLHFAVAVQGPRGRVHGQSIPPLWFAIDPFGVYDYRRNRDSVTDYNYLPDNRLDAVVRGVRHAYVFQTNPPIGSLQVTPRDSDSSP